MALFVGTNKNDTISPATISAGVLIVPAGSDLSGDDSIASLDGDDVVEPDTGDDIAALGGGDDRFIWNPGDGDDTVEGGADTDTLEFNGAGGVDIMTITTLEEGRFLFFRDPADITVDATNVELIEANGLGGNDIIIAALQTDPDVSLIVDGGDGNDFIIGGAGDDESKVARVMTLPLVAVATIASPGTRATATTLSMAASGRTRSSSMAQVLLNS